jgi:hypothetical protein
MNYACSTCRIEKPVTEFRHRKEGLKKLRSSCLMCERERNRVWSNNNRTKRSAYSRLWRAKNRGRHNWSHRAYANGFKLTLEEYTAKYNYQSGLCAICKTYCSAHGKQCLAIDHNHKTGKVRSLLCRHCNMMIGQASENPKILQAAIEYLAKWNEEQNGKS